MICLRRTGSLEPLSGNLKILLSGFDIESSRARQSKVEDESPNRCDDIRCYEIENRQNDESHRATFVNFV